MGRCTLVNLLLRQLSLKEVSPGQSVHKVTYQKNGQLKFLGYTSRVQTVWRYQLQKLDMVIRVKTQYRQTGETGIKTGKCPVNWIFFFLA